MRSGLGTLNESVQPERPLQVGATTTADPSTPQPRVNQMAAPYQQLEMAAAVQDPSNPNQGEPLHSSVSKVLYLCHSLDAVTSTSDTQC